MVNPNEVFTDDELAGFVQELAETVVRHQITLEMIQRCLPLMGNLRDFGWNPAECLAALLPLGGDRPAPGAPFY